MSTVKDKIDAALNKRIETEEGKAGNSAAKNTKQYVTDFVARRPLVSERIVRKYVKREVDDLRDRIREELGFPRLSDRLTGYAKSAKNYIRENW